VERGGLGRHGRRSPGFGDRLEVIHSFDSANTKNPFGFTNHPLSDSIKRLPLDCLRTIRHLPQPVDPRVRFTRRLKEGNFDKVAYRLTSLLSPSSG
jgi:hypothetical protein